MRAICAAQRETYASSVALFLLCTFATSAVGGASDTKDTTTAESSLECSQIRGGEMAMANSCLMPFGIMTGEAGKWMVGYQFTHEKMDGSLVGIDDISVSQILKQFPNAPTDMTMDMHMWMVMYAPTERLTLGAMIPYIRKEMNNVSADGSRFVMRADGVGDLEFRPSYLIFPNGRQATPVASQWRNRRANRLDRRGYGRISTRLLHATRLGHGITAARPYISRTRYHVELGRRFQGHRPAGPQRSQLPIRESLRIACLGRAATN